MDCENCKIVFPDCGDCYKVRHPDLYAIKNAFYNLRIKKIVLRYLHKPKSSLTLAVWTMLEKGLDAVEAERALILLGHTGYEWAEFSRRYNWLPVEDNALKFITKTYAL